MKWEFHYRTYPDYLEVIISGNISPDELNRMAIERWQELRKHDCGKILFDFTRITNSLKTLDIYNRPEQSEKVGVSRTNHAAAVVPDIYLNDFKFMETVYLNRGFDLHVFTDRQHAVEYLAGAS
jgi:hypothetical protein